MIRVREQRDLTLRNVDLLEDLVLGEGGLDIFGVGLLKGFDLFSSWLVAGDLAALDFTLQAVGGSLDGHAGAVEGEWEEGVFADLFLKPRLEFSLRHGISMA